THTGLRPLPTKKKLSRRRPEHSIKLKNLLVNSNLLSRHKDICIGASNLRDDIDFLRAKFLLHHPDFLPCHVALQPAFTEEGKFLTQSHDNGVRTAEAYRMI